MYRFLNQKKVIPLDLTFMYQVCGSDVTLQHNSLLSEVASFKWSMSGKLKFMELVM